MTDFEITGLENTPWTLTYTWKEESQVGLFDFQLDASEDAELPQLTIQWHLPMGDAVNCWTTAHKGSTEFPPDWGSDRCFSIADEIPQLVFHNREGRCNAAAAFSDAMRTVIFRGGVLEADCTLRFALMLFRRKEAKCRHYHGVIRLDTRPLNFADTVRDFCKWYSTFPEYAPMPAPAAALEPLYSTWYSYHHDVHEDEMEAECAEAVKYGMKTIIVDSGWHTDDNALGTIACGDWQVCPSRFKDMAAHVKRIQAMGMKYMLWFAVPFIGKNSKMYQEFKDRYLFELDLAGVLDPRFPSVRKYLVEQCRRLMQDYGLDGMKLDFINTFTECTDDPMLKEGMRDRDCPTIPGGIDKLMMEIAQAINAIRPNALIEFRQCYIGPAIRKYGNIFRAADCPADHGGNRRRTINLRLTSGETVVHSDMLEWRMDCPVDFASLQLWSIIFSVPQISVRMNELPPEHRKMLDFILKFNIRHRKLLVQSPLYPRSPEENYPVVFAQDGDERILVVYSAGKVATFPEEAFQGSTYLVNATQENSLVVDLPFAPKSALLRTCTGEEIPFAVPQAGLSRLSMPAGSILKMQ